MVPIRTTGANVDDIALTDPGASLPQPVVANGGLTPGFPVPGRIADRACGAGCPTDFLDWTPVPNSGTNGNPPFTVPLSSGSKGFISLRVSQR